MKFLTFLLVHRVGFFHLAAQSRNSAIYVDAACLNKLVGLAPRGVFVQGKIFIMRMPQIYHGCAIIRA